MRFSESDSGLDARKQLRGKAESGGDEEFWAAVESRDVDALGGALQMDDESHRRALATLLPRLSTWRRQKQEQSRRAWRYRVIWKPVARSGARGELRGTWALMVPARAAQDELVGRLSVALAERGGTVKVIAVRRRGSRAGGSCEKTA